MLKLKYLFENYELAKYALHDWEHDEENLDNMLSHYRISSNAIYPFTNHEKIQFLRLAPVEEKQYRNIVGEIEFIQYLRKNGYKAMKPILSKNGKLSLTFDSEWGSYFASVFDRVDGIPIENTDYTDDIMIQYGKALGKLHKLSSNYSAQNKKWNYIDVLAWIKEELKKYKNTELAIAEEAKVERELSKLSKTKNNFGLVHYDFEPDNVFYCKETNDCSVIDFDDAMYHWFALDLEQCFDSLGEELEGERLATAKRKFIEGYNTEYEFTDEMKTSLPLMRRFINLFVYTRLIYSTDERFEEEPDWMLGLREKFNGVIKRLEESF